MRSPFGLRFVLLASIGLLASFTASAPGYGAFRVYTPNSTAGGTGVLNSAPGSMNMFEPFLSFNVGTFTMPFNFNSYVLSYDITEVKTAGQPNKLIVNSLSLTLTSVTGSPPPSASTVSIAIYNDGYNFPSTVGQYLQVYNNTSTTPSTASLVSNTIYIGDASGSGSFSSSVGTSTSEAIPVAPPVTATTFYDETIRPASTTGNGNFIAQMFTFTFSGAATITLMSDTAVTTPAPATAVAAFSVLPLLGFLRLRRRATAPTA